VSAPNRLLVFMHTGDVIALANACKLLHICTFFQVKEKLQMLQKLQKESVQMETSVSSSTTDQGTRMVDAKVGFACARVWMWVWVGGYRNG